MTDADGWITVEVERALYVDRGVNTVLCDRLPSPVTLVLKLATADPKPKPDLRSLVTPEAVLRFCERLTYEANEGWAGQVENALLDFLTSADGKA